MYAVTPQETRDFSVRLNPDQLHFPLLKSMIQGDIKATFYMDDQTEPTAMLVIGDNNWCYALGDFDTSRFQEKALTFLTDQIQEGARPLLWFGITDHTKKLLEETVGIQVGDYPRYTFKFSPNQFKPITQEQSGFTLEPINEDNIDSFIPLYEGFFFYWTSKDRFLAKGQGVVAKSEGQILGYAVGASVADGEVEMDLFTDKDHRGKGVSSLLTSKLIETCLAAGLKPKWDCAVANEASIRLAKKNGFEIVGEYGFGYVYGGEAS